MFVSSTSRCSLFVRYCTDDYTIREDFLKFLPMKGYTRGSDYIDIICTFLEENGIDIKRLICNMHGWLPVYDRKCGWVYFSFTKEI